MAQKRKSVASKKHAGNSFSSKEKILLGFSICIILFGILALFIISPSSTKTKKDVNTTVEKEKLREKIDEKVDNKPSTVEDKIALYIQLYASGDLDSFSTSDLIWMKNSGQLSMRARAADLFNRRGETEEAQKLFEEIISVASTSPTDTNILDVAYDQLSQIYMTQFDSKNAIRVFQAALEGNTSLRYANRWYGFWLQLLLENQEMEEVQRVVSECLLKHRNNNHFIPFHCYHQAGMLAMFDGDLSGALHLFFKVYRDTLQNWKDEEGNSCPSMFVPLAIDTPFSIVDEKRNQLIIDANMSMEWNKEEKCSEQEWPYILSSFMESGEYVQRVEYYEEDLFGKMGCFTEEEKKAVLYKIEDATVLGAHQIITHQEEQGKCVTYTPGFPYLNSNAQPRFSGMEKFSYLDLPIKHFENAMVLHFIDINYYHFTIECLSKIILALHHPEFENIDLRILVSPTSVAYQYFSLLQILPSAEMYEPTLYRYHIDNLYVIDWKFTSDISENSLRVDNQHFEDYFVPPTDVLQYSRSVLYDKIPEDIIWEPRNYVVFLHRKSGARTIRDPLPLYKSLSYISKMHGLQFRIHGFSDETIEEQIQLFSRAVVVIGIHGAGFTNMIFCKKNSAIIELPVTPEKVSVYSRMASAFNFPYYTVPSAKFYHFHSLEYFNSKMLADTEDTLYAALHNLGYSYN